MRILAVLILCLPFPALAENMPACAKTGAKSVFFNGAPALKLSDVIACPPGSWTLIPNIVIEGEPMVHLNCATSGSANVIAGGEAANTVGDTACASQ